MSYVMGLPTMLANPPQYIDSRRILLTLLIIAGEKEEPELNCL